jgi:Cu(I)/Ag(I) efflux system membrane fusion protein
VVSGQFLIDSEASLKASLRRLSEPAAAEIWGEGVVNKIDPAARTANVSHGPIPALDWPPMTMDFQLAEALDAGQFKPGAKVRFALEQNGSGYVITAVKPL